MAGAPGRVKAKATLAAELAARQLWFRLSEPMQERVQRRLGGRGSSAGPPPARISCDELAAGLRALHPEPPRLLLVHSSADRLRLLGADGEPMPGPKAALAVLEILEEWVGREGTLCMPTHPLYRADPGFLYDKSDLVLEYRPDRTPSSVGLVTEYFRRSPGTLRSRHPLSSLAARGPLAEELLEGNLNDREPLPHGADSGYLRLCQAGASVLGIGLAPQRYMTILHVPEEVRDADWPVPDFFLRRRFRVTDAEGTAEVVVRERRPEFVRSLSMGQLCRDVREDGILREAEIGGIPAGVIDARAMWQMMVERQRATTYPYFLTRIAAIGRAPRPPTPPSSRRPPPSRQKET